MLSVSDTVKTRDFPTRKKSGGRTLDLRGENGERHGL